MPSSKNNDGLLARVNFPLYTVQMLTSRHILVGGGGGAAKTGVANGFEIFELDYDGSRYSAKEIIRHETGTKVVMNTACFANKQYTYLVAGQESHCQLYRISITVEKISSNEQANGLKENLTLRNRKASKNQKNGTLDSSSEDRKNKQLCFRFDAGDSIQTDFSEKEPYQRVVAISRCGEWMATGGIDCCVRLWSFPSMRLSKMFKAHTKEIDDLHFSQDSKQLVSIAKDGQALIWDIKTGKQLHSLSWTPPSGIKYLFKRSRFGAVEGRSSKLFTVSNPVGGGRDAVGWLHSWEDGALCKAVSLPEPTSALAVRDDGTFLAVGTMFSGSVSIYIAFSLQRVLHVEGAHSMFVTGVELLPSTCAWGTSEAAALSISVDNKICIHSLPFRRTLPPWIVVILMIGILFLTFLLCSYIGL